MGQTRMTACKWHVLCICSCRQDAHLAIADCLQYSYCAASATTSFSQLCSLSGRIPLTIDRGSDWHQ